MLDLFARASPLAPRPPLARAHPLAWALAMSMFVHLAIVWRLAFGLPSIPARGEDGRQGAGGATFEVTMRGPAAEARVPVASDVAEPSTPSIAHPPRPDRPIARAVPATADRGAATARDVRSASANPGAPATPAIAATGTGDDATDSGRLRGRDDARIRALLEGSVGGALGGSSLGDVAILERVSRCPDPIAGTWTAHRYSPEFRDWARFTLNITRDGDELHGTIRTRMWRGMPSDTRPPACLPGGWDYTVEMTARGQVRGEHFDFGAREHHIAHVECSSPAFGYNADHFMGEVDVALDQLHTVNNDGGRDVNASYTFRRSSCQP